MKNILQEVGETLLIFLATLTITMGTCTKKAVTCGSDPAPSAEVNAP